MARACSSKSSPLLWHAFYNLHNHNCYFYNVVLPHYYILPLHLLHSRARVHSHVFYPVIPVIPAIPAQSCSVLQAAGLHNKAWWVSKYCECQSRKKTLSDSSDSSDSSTVVFCIVSRRLAQQSLVGVKVLRASVSQKNSAIPAIPCSQ